jgi:hypothetical protein
MIAVTNLFIVGEPTNGPFLAQRFVTEFEQRKKEIHHDVDYPEDPMVQKVIDFTIANGLDLRRFQRNVIDTFDQYAMTFFDDDLVEQLIEEGESPDMHDVIQIIAEFQTENPGYIVQSLIPLDLKGAFGYVVKATPNGNTEV